jgi:hypothetical protein
MAANYVAERHMAIIEGDLTRNESDQQKTVVIPA